MIRRDVVTVRINYMVEYDSMSNLLVRWSTIVYGTHYARLCTDIFYIHL
jgi:hypothetical protein